MEVLSPTPPVECLSILGGEPFGYCNTRPLFIIASAILFVGFGTIGLRVLTETDDAWEHTPEWRGFRPMITH